MGLFSWNCKECGKSIKAPYAIPKSIAWQNECVVLAPKLIAAGPYDGYGRVGGWDWADSEEEPEMYHEKCWEQAGKPVEFSGPSDMADDKGYFYDWDEDEVEY